METQAVVFDADYFINKFTLIPAEQWCIRDFVDGDACCALGHCGQREGDEPTKESAALDALFSDKLGESVEYINDGATFVDGRTRVKNEELVEAPHPKQRVLRALQLIKAKETQDG